MKEWVVNGFRDACASITGWSCVIATTLVLGFCAGYSIGHRQFAVTEELLTALSKIPMLWFGNSQVLFAYAVTAVAWYLPIHYDESRWLRIVAALANFLVWLFIIWWVVVSWENAKFNFFGTRI
jgi:hypothetical protein